MRKKTMQYNLSYFKKINGKYEFIEKIVEFDTKPTDNEIIGKEGDGLYHTIKVTPVVVVKNNVVQTPVSDSSKTRPSFIPTRKSKYAKE
jgi:hypothetical protein